MTRVIARRLLIGLAVLFVVSLLVFAASLLVPGDSARAALGHPAAPERLAALRARLYLDQPVYVGYLSWLGDLVTGDLGTSVATGRSVADLVGERTANSAALVFCSAVVAAPVAVFVGVWTALRRGAAVDRVSSVAGRVFASVPEFVVGICSILLLSTVVLHWFPAVAWVDGDRSVWSQASVLVLPTLTLAVAVVPRIAGRVRAAIVEVLDGEYVAQARLRGVPERTVLWRHAAPNVFGPVARALTWQLGWLVAALVVVEYLFDYPGVGQGLVHAVASHDLPTVQALLMLVAVACLLARLLGDVVSVLADPRQRAAA